MVVGPVAVERAFVVGNDFVAGIGSVVALAEHPFSLGIEISGVLVRRFLLHWY